MKLSLIVIVSLLVLFTTYRVTGALVFLALLGVLVGVSIMATVTALLVRIGGE